MSFEQPKNWEVNEKLPETAQRDSGHFEGSEKKRWLEKLRSSKPLRWVVLGLALEILPLAWHVKDKKQELQEIETLEQLAKEHLAEYVPLEEKGKRAKKLFGDCVPFELDVEEQLNAIKGSEGIAHNLRKTFSWFKEPRPILGRPLDKETGEKGIEKSEVEVSNMAIVGWEKEEEWEMDTSTFRKILETYPDGWVIGEVVSITQEARNAPMPERYGLAKGSTSTAAFYSGTERITFDTKPHPYEILDILAHELGHANDWESDEEMTDEERLDLLLAVGDRIDDEDRYRSSYVESIKNKDRERERYLKATEYWAEICEAYFTQPYNLNAKDYALVEARVKRHDPEFNDVEARFHQAKLVYSSTYGKTDSHR